MSWIERDSKLLWHPYTQHGLGVVPALVLGARGGYLELEDGTVLLDAISSWWVNLHGHCHPKIVAAISDQAAKLEHVIFSGFTHTPGIELSELLLNAAQKAGSKLTRNFFSDNGSTAVEVALKMAFQYHINRGQNTRTRFIALRHSYHGDTLGAMSVSDPDGYHTKFKSLLFPTDFIEPGNIDQLAELLKAHPESHAAIIMEPLLQGAGGMKMYQPKFLQEAVELCKKYGVLVICDEVFTGFYRTGKCFAFEHAGIAPQLVCLSKGITGGFMPLASTLCEESIYQAFLSTDTDRAFLHGHSYTANPIACAAGIASWKLLQEPETQKNIATLVQKTTQAIAGLSGHPQVKEARALGTIGAIELKAQATYGSSLGREIYQAAWQRGILLRPLGNVIYMVPPYCLTGQELQRIYTCILDILDQLKPL